MPRVAAAVSVRYIRYSSRSTDNSNSLDTQVTFNFTWNSGNAVGGVNVLFAWMTAWVALFIMELLYVVPTLGLNSYTFTLQNPI